MPPRNLPRRTASFLAGPGGRSDDAEANRLIGLSADFPRLVEIDLDRIRTNPDQPRTSFDEASLAALADSIRRHGLQQPVLVRSDSDGRYTLVAGERRLRAHRMLERRTIFAILTDGNPDEIALVENLQRVDLDAIDLARSLSRLIEAHGYTHEAVAALIGCDRSEISRSVAVLRLPADIQEDYRNRAREVSRSALIEVALAAGERQQRALWAQAKAGLGVRGMRDSKRAERAGTEPGGRALLEIGKALLRLDREVERLNAHTAPLDPAHRDRLRLLRDAIDRLIEDGPDGSRAGSASN